MSPRRKPTPEPAAPAAPWYEDPDQVALAVRPFRDAWFGYCAHVPRDPENPVLASQCTACLNGIVHHSLGMLNDVALPIERATAAWSAVGADPRRSR